MTCAFCSSEATYVGKRPGLLVGYDEYIRVCEEHREQVDATRPIPPRSEGGSE